MISKTSIFTGNKIYFADDLKFSSCSRFNVELYEKSNHKEDLKLWGSRGNTDNVLTDYLNYGNF